MLEAIIEKGHRAKVRVILKGETPDKRRLSKEESGECIRRDRTPREHARCSLKEGMLTRAFPCLEDLINAELSKNLPLNAEALSLPMWDPHVKAFLLLQAHFSRIDLPISDYVGDQNSVLDQSIRIVQASVDVLTELGYLSSCTMMITLLQCIKSARWPMDGPLSIFPGVNINKERARAKDGGSQPPSLAQIHNVAKPVLSKVLNSLDVPHDLEYQVEKAICTLPNLQVYVIDVSALGLTVGVARLNPATQADYRIYAPKFPKPQSEGFFIVVTDPAKDEVLALKRINWPPPGKVSSGRNKPTSRSIVKLKPESVERKVDVLVVSDAYVEMMWKIEGIEMPAAPVVEDDNGKKSS